MLKVQLEPAYILHRHKYRETSLLLDVFSREQGRIGLVAKGVLRNKKQQANPFEPYQRYRISWVSRTDLGTLTDIEPEPESCLLKNQQVFSGFYMNELIIHLLHRHEPHPDLFDAYETSLKSLTDGQPEDITLRFFEKKLLQILGYGLVLDTDVQTGEPIQPDRHYIYMFEQGPIADSPQSRDGLPVSGNTLLALEREDLLQDVQLKESKQLLRAILNRYLGNKTLQSRELYNAFIKAGTTS